MNNEQLQEVMIKGHILERRDKLKVALATSDGAFVAKHFGNTPFFLIAEVDNKGWKILEKRKNAPACDHTGHDHERFTQSAKLIADCDAVICAKIGGFAQNGLSAMGLQALEKAGFCEDLLDKYVIYLNRNKNLTQRTQRNAEEIKENNKTQSAQSYAALKNNHPCFNDESHGKYGRIHLPVSAKCNIKCRFCERDINADELCPGVSRGILKPEQVADTVKRALELCPEISVIGIAGPGDALADNTALDVFKRIREKFPKLNLCLSTNGLGLAGKAKVLFDVGVQHLTVTVNAVDPVIGEKIVSHIIYEEKKYTGIQAAEILLERQLAGIKEAADLGMEIKINTVLIPGVNDKHIAEIAKKVSELGAKRHNVMPLIPRGEFVGAVPPDCAAVEKAHKQSEKYLTVFRHCAHCRADACGIPGKSEFSGELYKNLEGFRCGNSCG